MTMRHEIQPVQHHGEASDARLRPDQVADSDQALEAWRQIQAEFVDDPQQSVAHAHRLVSDLMERAVADLAQQRDALEKQRCAEAEPSTEHLRVCLQNYRAFLTRLLPSVPQGSPR